MPAAFRQAQNTCAAVLASYASRGEAFARPCPACGSCEFMLPDEDQQRHAGSSEGGRRGAGIMWESRPLVCDQCQRWWHLGCLGVHHLEDVPCLPWFHHHECRRMHLGLEAEAERGELPAWELGPAGAGLCRVSVVTDSDHRGFVLGSPGGHRGDVKAIYEILSSALPSHLVLGYGSGAAEYGGGKHALLLRAAGGQPVAAATFDTYGATGLAQLHLLATSEEARGQGYARALMEVLEYRLQRLGIRRLVTQPRGACLDMFTDSFGYEVVHPVDAALLHARIPVAFMDAPLVEKELA